MICGKCPFFDACRCKSMETGATNGKCSLIKDENPEEHNHLVNSKSKCIVSPEIREEALFDLVRHQGWIIDTLITEIKGICMGVDGVAKSWKDPKFEVLNKFTSHIKEHLEKDFNKDWRKS